MLDMQGWCLYPSGTWMKCMYLSFFVSMTSAWDDVWMIFKKCTEMCGESSIGSQFWVQVECSLKLTVARFVEAFKWTCCVHHFEVNSEYIYIYIERELRGINCRHRWGMSRISGDLVGGCLKFEVALGDKSLSIFAMVKPWIRHVVEVPN